MDIFDSINAFLMSSPDSLEQLQWMFRIKFFVLLILAVYFLSLPYRHQKKEKHLLNEHATRNNGKGGKFIA
jgi:hypothetical protein